MCGAKLEETGAVGLGKVFGRGFRACGDGRVVVDDRGKDCMGEGRERVERWSVGWAGWKGN